MLQEELELSGISYDAMMTMRLCKRWLTVNSLPMGEASMLVVADKNNLFDIVTTDCFAKGNDELMINKCVSLIIYLVSSIFVFRMLLSVYGYANVKINLKCYINYS